MEKDFVVILFLEKEKRYLLHISHPDWTLKGQLHLPETEDLVSRNTELNKQKNPAFFFSMPSSFTSAFSQFQRHGEIRNYLVDVNTPFSAKAYTQPEEKQNKKPK